MAHHIAAWIKTEPVLDEVRRTTIEWAIPAPDEDADKFVRLATKRFADELRNTIEAQR